MKRNRSFFLQGEDGIRDRLVTGVQTCGLPICPLSRPRTITHRRDPSEAGKLSFNKLAELVVGIDRKTSCRERV